MRRPVGTNLRLAACGAALLALAVEVRASELVDVRPLTDAVLVLHFVDGHVVHHSLGHPRSDEGVITSPLDLRAAGRAVSYAITSADDTAYRAPRTPAAVGRKSKGTDFAWFADRWVDGRAVNTRSDHTSEHWIYLVLPSPLRRGASYAVESGSLATNGSRRTFTFDEARTRSEAVHVNLLGYVPEAPRKYAYVYHWMGDRGSLDLASRAGASCRVIDQDSTDTVFAGRLAFRAEASRQETARTSDSPPHGSFLNAEVYECDFSALRRPGRYVVAVDGVGSSFPFRIDADVYREAFVTVARGLFHNRSGIALEEPYTRFTRPAPHNPRLTPGFAGRLQYTALRFVDWGSEGGDAKQLLAAAKGPIESAGWYQDAGDWDSYESHLRVPQELLTVFEMAPANFRPGELRIPESPNGLPDILNEAAWLPRFCFRLRHELMDKGYGSGGIGLRIAGDAFGSDEGTLADGTKVGRGSWQDTDRTWVASGEDPWSTYRYAGVAAHLAFGLRLAGRPDPEGVDWTREAREAYAWASRNTRPGDETKDPPLRERRAYAAASLFRVTGERGYEQQLIDDTRDVTPATLLWGDRHFGPMVYVLGGGPAAPDAATDARLRAALLATADHVLVEVAGKRALRWGGEWTMPMLVGQQTTPWLVEGAVGYTLARREGSPKAELYLAALYTSCDYFLGTNALNTTWVTGLGPRHPLQVFHMDAWYNGKGEPHPGVIPYSPWRKEKPLGQGPWDVDWANATAYPDIDLWPGNERWFSNRCSPMASEFTIHQNTAPAAAIFGFLSAPGPGAAAVRKD